MALEALEDPVCIYAAQDVSLVLCVTNIVIHMKKIFPRDMYMYLFFTNCCDYEFEETI